MVKCLTVISFTYAHITCRTHVFPFGFAFTFTFAFALSLFFPNAEKGGTKLWAGTSHSRPNKKRERCVMTFM